MFQPFIIGLGLARRFRAAPKKVAAYVPYRDNMAALLEAQRREHASALEAKDREIQKLRALQEETWEVYEQERADHVRTKYLLAGDLFSGAACFFTGALIFFPLTFIGALSVFFESETARQTTHTYQNEAPDAGDGTGVDASETHHDAELVISPVEFEIWPPLPPVPSYRLSSVLVWGQERPFMTTTLRQHGSMQVLALSSPRPHTAVCISFGSVQRE